jgi:hypothetical protein
MDNNIKADLDTIVDEINSLIPIPKFSCSVLTPQTAKGQTAISTSA